MVMPASVKTNTLPQVCVYHPPSLPQKGSGLYAAEAPYRQKEEESRRFAEYGKCFGPAGRSITFQSRLRVKG